MTTIYKYQTQGGRVVEFEDPTDQYQPEDIRQHWAQTFPELAQATITETEEDGKKIVTFAKKVGTKGNDVAAQFKQVFVVRPRGIPHRYRVIGLVEWGHYGDEIDITVESYSQDEAQNDALAVYQSRHPHTRGTHWVDDEPPEVEDMGEVPMDIWMRRQRQPELFEVGG